MAVLLSGGFSTQLENYVDEKEISGSPLWCCQYLASNPDVIVRTHQDYIKGECLENSSQTLNLYATLSVYRLREVRSFYFQSFSTLSVVNWSILIQPCKKVSRLRKGSLSSMDF